jgi:hypothetical protein
MGNIAELISKYGFPIVAAVGMSYMIYFVWTWATKEIKPVLKNANTVLIALIDRIRMLDNDLIRLNQKVNIVLQLRKMEHDELIKTANEFVVKDENGAVPKPTDDAGNTHKEEPKKK